MLRYFAFFALFALAAARPASDDVPRPITAITDAEFEDPSPWFKFPPFGNIFAPLSKLFSSFADIGPRIEIDDDKFRVIVNVKDYKKEDLKVKVKGDFILVQGAHEAKHDDHDLFASQFFHTYTLPTNASAADVTATLTSDGYLDVTAPINGADEKYQGKEREVPIIEGGKSLKDDKAPVIPASIPIAPVENVDKVENFDKIEPLDAPVEPLAKVENIEPTAAVEKIENVEPTVAVEKVAHAEPSIPVTTETAYEAEPENKEITTPASDREDAAVPIEDIKVPQDNEVNEIQP